MHVRRRASTLSITVDDRVLVQRSRTRVQVQPPHVQTSLHIASMKSIRGLWMTYKGDSHSVRDETHMFVLNQAFRPRSVLGDVFVITRPSSPVGFNVVFFLIGGGKAEREKAWQSGKATWWSIKYSRPR